MGQERPHLAGAHLARMALVVKQDKSLDPADVRLFRSVGQVLDSAGVGHLVEKPWLAWFWLKSACGGGLGRVEVRRLWHSTGAFAV